MPSVLTYKPQRITDVCPVNFGYETGGAKKGYPNLAVHYGRWTNIVGCTQLERVIQELASDKFAYQCLKFSCVYAGTRYFYVQALQGVKSNRSSKNKSTIWMQSYRSIWIERRSISIRDRQAAKRTENSCDRESYCSQVSLCHDAYQEAFGRLLRDLKTDER